jgi:hypothetical protein
VAACGLARADLLSIGFQESVLSGGPGSTVLFSGTLTNLTNSTLYLNADDLNLAGFDASAIDDSAFFANTPTGFLGPNASTGNIGLFNVTIPNPFASGGYNGTFQILGGGTFDDQTILDSVGFTVQVASGSTAVPEPGSFILMLTVLIIIVISLSETRSTRPR